MLIHVDLDHQDQFLNYVVINRFLVTLISIINLEFLKISQIQVYVLHAFDRKSTACASSVVVVLIRCLLERVKKRLIYVNDNESDPNLNDGYMYVLFV